MLTNFISNISHFCFLLVERKDVLTQGSRERVKSHSLDCHGKTDLSPS